MSRSPETIPSDYMLFTTKLSRKGCAGTSSTKKSQIALCPKPELVVRRIDMSWITKDIEHCSNKEFVAKVALASSCSKVVDSTLAATETCREEGFGTETVAKPSHTRLCNSQISRKSCFDTSSSSRPNKGRASRRRGGTSLIDRLLVYENCLPNVSLGY